MSSSKGEQDSSGCIYRLCAEYAQMAEVGVQVNEIENAAKILAKHSNTKQSLFESGEAVLCAGCGDFFNKNMKATYQVTGKHKGRKLVIAPQFVDGFAFCSSICADSGIPNIEAMKKAQVAAIKSVFDTFPLSFNVRVVIDPSSIGHPFASFNLPTLNNQVEWYVGSTMLNIDGPDFAAFECYCVLNGI